MDDVLGHWLAGFTAGEGMFEFLIRKTGRGRYKFRPRFAISLRNDDAPILFEIAETLGCGHVYTEQDKGGKSAPKRNPMASYLCDDIMSLHNIIVPIFERYPLRAKKAREFTIWKEAIALMFRITRRRKINTRWGWFSRYTKEEKAQLRHYAQLLKDVRAYQAEAPSLPTRLQEPQLVLMEPWERK